MIGESSADVLGRPPHAHEIDEHRPTVDGRHVGGLVEVDAVDRLAQSRHRRDEPLEHETRVLAGGVEPGLARLARLDERRLGPRTVGG